MRINRDSEERPPGVRGFLYWWLESEYNDQRYIVDLFLTLVIILSIVILILDVSYGPSDQTPEWIHVTNLTCLFFFILEYLGRFWVNTDFLADIKHADSLFSGFKTAIGNKIHWMTRPFPLIDLIAIIPVGSLRALRMFRFFRIARLLRLLKLGRFSAGFSGFVEELKNRSFEFIALGGVVAMIILIGATAIFTVETPHMDGSLFNNFGDAIWWATVTTTTVGYGDIYPKYLGGRLIAAALMLSSIGIVGALGGILTSAMMERIRKMREGRVERITFKNHIVFCGWTPCAHKVAEMLNKTDFLEDHRLVVVNEDEVPDEDYLIPLDGNFSRPDNLRTVNAGDADYVVVFHQRGEEESHTEADRKSILTTLQAEKLNPNHEDPYTITELFDEEKAQIVTGKNIEGEETLDKEDFDANLIFNTIRYPGHTTKMFYNLADFTDQWIQIRDIDDFYSEEDLPVTIREFKNELLEREYGYTLIGAVYEGESQTTINPSNDRTIESGSKIFLVEQSPYEIEEVLEQTGIGSYDFDLSKNPLRDVESDYVFLGFNDCARRLLNKLEASDWQKNDSEIIVISEQTPPDRDYLVHIPEEFSESSYVDDSGWWKDKELGIIFHEEEGDPDKIDIRTAVTALALPSDVRLIAEVIEEDFARVLQRDIERDIELIYKERYDANVIANSILNRGNMTGVFKELGTPYGNQLTTFSLSEFTPDEEITIGELRKQCLDEDRLVFLGMLKKQAFQPTLNPDLDKIVTQDDIIYCLVHDE